VIDLEKLIADRQDALRGRSRDWIDDFGDWRRNVDWVRVVLVVATVALVVTALR
jgi:hypothetical protein